MSLLTKIKILIFILKTFPWKYFHMYKKGFYKDIHCTGIIIFNSEIFETNWKSVEKGKTKEIIAYT